jgi:hypothetical protein
VTPALFPCLLPCLLAGSSRCAMCDVRVASAVSYAAMYMCVNISQSVTVRKIKVSSPLNTNRVLLICSCEDAVLFTPRSNSPSLHSLLPTLPTPYTPYSLHSLLPTLPTPYSLSLLPLLTPYSLLPLLALRESESNRGVHIDPGMQLFCAAAVVRYRPSTLHLPMSLRLGLEVHVQIGHLQVGYTDIGRRNID